MVLVQDIMTKSVITVSPDTEILAAAKILLEKHINGLPVVDDEGKLVGILCQSDLIAQQKKLPVPSLFSFWDGYITLSSMKRIEQQVGKIIASTVSQAMTPNPVTVTSQSRLETVAALMVDQNYHTLPVVEGDKLVGIIGKEDVLRTITPGIEPETEG